MKLSEYLAARNIAACEPSRLRAFLAQLENQSRALPAVCADSSLEEEFDEYFYPELPQMTIDSARRLAIIPVSGLIVRGFSTFEQRYFGLCDLNYVSQMLDQAEANPDVDTYLFDINSPGGYINGLEELAERIAALTASNGVTTLAYTDSLCASAAYYLASQCGTIAASRSATVGSIGTLCTFIDSSRMLDDAGIKVQVFASGKYKGMCTPGTSLTDEQATLLQSEIEAHAATFKATVTSCRPDVADDTMQGQCFTGAAALDAHLIDQLSPSRAAFLAAL